VGALDLHSGRKPGGAHRPAFIFTEKDQPRRRLGERALEVVQLNRDFADILVGGEIVPSAALPEEQNEPDLAELPRLVLTPKRKNFGRIRQLIDAVNRAETE